MCPCPSWWCDGSAWPASQSSTPTRHPARKWGRVPCGRRADGSVPSWERSLRRGAMNIRRGKTASGRRDPAGACPGRASAGRRALAADIMAFSFVHTGDLHLDSPFVGLTAEAPPNVAALLRESTILAWRNIVDLALEEQVDFLLVAGDAFERANRTLRGQLVFRDGLARLAEAGIASFVVTGNHDPAGRLGAVGHLARAGTPLPGPRGDRPAGPARRRGDRPRLRRQLPPAGHHHEPGQALPARRGRALRHRPAARQRRRAGRRRQLRPVQRRPT